MFISQIIDSTLNEVLLGTYRAHYNQISGTLAYAQTSVQLVHPIVALGEGSYIEVDQELMYVIPGGINESTRTVSVIRGARGTEIAVHLDRAGVSISPRFPRIIVFGAMQEEARSWPISLFQVSSFDSGINSFETSVDVGVTSGFDDIIRVIQAWRITSGGRYVRLSGWRYETGMLGLGSSNLFLARASGTQAVRILVARKFNDIEEWDEDTELIESGIPDEYADILKYGAAWRLVNGRETKRLFTEVESEGRVAADVPATANLTLGRQLKSLRDTRVGEEISRLRSYYGLRGV